MDPREALDTKEKEITQAEKPRKAQETEAANAHFVSTSSTSQEQSTTYVSKVVLKMEWEACLISLLIRLLTVCFLSYRGHSEEETQ